MRKHPDAEVADVAASFQAAVVDVLVAKLLRAAHRTGIETVVIGGGVAANSSLRAHVLDGAAPGRSAGRAPEPGAVHRQRGDGRRPAPGGASVPTARPRSTTASTPASASCLSAAGLAPAAPAPVPLALDAGEC